MRLDLYGVRIEHQPQTLLDYLARKSLPVKIWIGREVRIVVTDCTIHLAEDFNCSNMLRCSPQTRDDVGDFLAQCSRAGGLTMRARHHGYIGMLVCEFGESID